MWRELQRVGESRSIAEAGRPQRADTHFAIFGLAPGYDIDTLQLHERYRDLQRTLHPDRYAQATEAERRASALVAARVNDAYATLRDPLARARYLLALHGLDTADGQRAALDPDFLQAQFEWREAFDSACGSRDRTAFDALTGRLRTETRRRYDALASDFAQDDTLQHAASVVAELQFLEKLAADVVEALDRWEAL